MLLHSSLCTLGLRSQGLKERPYHCPPGPAPSPESVSLGVKAGGKVKPGKRGRAKRQRCKNERETGRGEEKNGERETKRWEKIERNRGKSKWNRLDRGCAMVISLISLLWHLPFWMAKLSIYHQHLPQCERNRRVTVTCTVRMKVLIFWLPQNRKNKQVC